jgi:hypothetical protein
MAAAPPLPNATAVAVSIYDTCIPCARTGLTGHSGPPTPPTVRKHKRKKKTPRQNRQKEEAKEKYNLGRAWAPLLSALLLPPVLRGHSPASHAPYPRGAQKL